MKLTSFRIGAALALLLSVFTNSANAVLIVNIERLSDTSARLTGSGSLTGTAISNDHILYFDNLFSSLLTGNVNDDVFSSSTMTIGGKAIDFSHTISTVYNWDGASSGMYAASGGSSLSAGDSLSSGYLDISIASVSSSPLFATSGSTGDIYWGVNTDNIVGTWTMSDSHAVVPAPAAIWLFGSGLIGLTGVARRKKV